MSVRGIFACSSISRTSGRIWALGELAYAVAEEELVLGEQGERRGVRGGFLRHDISSGPGVPDGTANVIIDTSAKTEHVRGRGPDAGV